MTVVGECAFKNEKAQLSWDHFFKNKFWLLLQDSNMTRLYIKIKQSGMPQLGPFVYTQLPVDPVTSLSWPLLKLFALNGIQCSLGLQNLTSESKPLRMQLVHQHSFIWGCWLKSKGQKQASSMICWFHLLKSNYNIQVPAPYKTSSASSFCPLNKVCVLWLQFQYWWLFECVVLHRSCMEWVIVSTANFL